MGYLWGYFIADLNLRPVEYFCVGWNWFCQPYVTTNDTVVSNYCLTSQNCCSCVNCYIIFNSRMSHFILKDFFYRQSSQSHSLINLYVITNYCSLSNHCTSSMIDRETSSNFSSGVNINTSFIMGALRNKSWNHWDSQLVKFMCKSVKRKSWKTWVSSDDFDLASGSGIRR